jgi:hypothetical protein
MLVKIEIVADKAHELGEVRASKEDFLRAIQDAHKDL